MSYKSYYVWPNEAFPFRVYLESKNLRIFIIENLQHNFDWLSAYRNRISKRDFFIVILGSHWSQGLLDNALGMFDALNLDKDQFYILTLVSLLHINFQETINQVRSHLNTQMKVIK